MSHRLVHIDHINITSQRVFYGPDKYCMDDLIVTHNYTGKYFSILKIGRIFLKKNFYEEYLTRGPTFIKIFFESLDF